MHIHTQMHQALKTQVHCEELREGHRAEEGKDKGLWKWTVLNCCDRNSLSGEAVVNGTETN